MAHFSSNRNAIDCDNRKDCVICCEPRRPPWKPARIPVELGKTPVNAFLKICELLKVSFLEIQHDWIFADNDNKTEALPFCSSCFSNFYSITKLHQQLTDIQKQIENKIGAVREKIRQAQLTNNGRQYSQKGITFRSKALNQDNVDSTTITPDISTTSYLPAEAPYGGSLNTLSRPSKQPAVLTVVTQSIPSSSTTHQFTYVQIDPPVKNIEPSTSNNFHLSSSEGVTEPEPVLTTLREAKYQQSYDHNSSNDGDFVATADVVDNYSSDSEQSEDNGSKEKVQLPTPEKKTRNYRSVKSSTDEDILATLFPRIAPTQNGGDANAETRSKRERQLEYFSPVVKTPDGKMIFEGIVITPVENGYECGQCKARVGKDHSSISLRKTKIHIKGFHLGAYKCHLCQKNFTSNDIISQHLARFHAPEAPCPTCGKPIKPNSRRNHQFTHLNAEEQKLAIAAGFKRYDSWSGEPTLQCRICDKKFDKPSKLKRHELIHVSAVFRRDFKCEHCDKGFTTHQARKEHTVQVHESLNARRRMCRICGESVFFKLFKRHMDLHLGLACKNCEKPFARLRTLHAHEAKCGKPRKKNDSYKFECDICHRFFSNTRILKNHRNHVHKLHWKVKVPLKYLDDLSVDNPKDQQNFDDLNNEGIQHEEGDIYSFQLYKIERMKTQEDSGRSVAGYRCYTCWEEILNDENQNEDWLDEQVKNHIRDKHIGSFSCKRCTKRFKNLHEAEAHKRIEHSTPSEVKVKDTLSTKKISNNCTSSKRKKINAHPCDVCGKRAEKRIKLHSWMHLNVWEVAEAVNQGEVYPVGFSASEQESLLKEMGVEVNLKCAVCNMDGFRTNEDLYNHRQIDHPDAPVIKLVKRLKIRQKPGRKKGQKYSRRTKAELELAKYLSEEGEEDDMGDCLNERKTRKRKILVLADEDGSDRDWDTTDNLDNEVEIKLETVMSASSDDEEDVIEWNEQSDGEMEPQVENRTVKRQKIDIGTELEDNQGARRDQRGLRRSTYKKRYYDEQESE